MCAVPLQVAGLMQYICSYEKRGCRNILIATALFLYPEDVGINYFSCDSCLQPPANPHLKVVGKC